MNQFDVSIEYAIFSKAYKEALDKILSDLSKRKYGLQQIWNRDNLSKEVLDKAHREQEYINNIVSYISTSESLINILMANLTNKLGLQIDWHEEYLRECEAHKMFVDQMIVKYHKLKNDAAA